MIQVPSAILEVFQEGEKKTQKVKLILFLLNIPFRFFSFCPRSFLTSPISCKTHLYSALSVLPFFIPAPSRVAKKWGGRGGGEQAGRGTSMLPSITWSLAECEGVARAGGRQPWRWHILEIQETSAGPDGPDPLRVRGLNTQNLGKKQRHTLVGFSFAFCMPLLF